MNHFSISEFVTAYGLLVGAADTNCKGKKLFLTKKQLRDSTSIWDSISPPVNFTNYMSRTRFKEFRQIIAYHWQDVGIFEENDPWWRYQKAVNELNGIRKELLNLSNANSFDETMCAVCPQTSFTGGLPNISNIKSKPEPIGVEGKSAISGYPLRVFQFFEIYKVQSILIYK